MANGPEKAKPKKPYDGFPLFAHRNGQWAKKIKGKLHYFGGWDDPQAALDKYLEQRDDLHAGRKPRRNGGTLSLSDLANSFLTWKRRLVNAGDLAQATFDGYHAACAAVLAEFGRDRPVDDVAADDFERLRATLAGRLSPTTLAVEITRVRAMFKFAQDRGLIDRAIRYGGAFNKPSRRLLRESRNDVPRAFEPSDLRRILDACDDHMTACVLLGINCAFGRADIGYLPRAALDLRRGWVNHPRKKTAIPRRCPLWPQTVEAVRKVLVPGDGPPVIWPSPEGPREPEPASRAIGWRFKRIIRDLGLYRRGVGHYTLRRTFETIGGDSRDQVAVDAIMGHSAAPNDMAAVYRGRIDDARLHAVVDHVRSWLFSDADQGEEPDVVRFIPKTG